MDTKEAFVVEQEKVLPADHDQWQAGPTRVCTVREQRCLLAQQRAWNRTESTCVAAELFSPPRFSDYAAKRGEEGAVLRHQAGLGSVEDINTATGRPSYAGATTE